VEELEALHAEKKAIYDAAVGSLEGMVSKLQSSVTDLQKDVEAASNDLDKTRSRVQDLEGLVQRMQAMGADELKRRWAGILMVVVCEIILGGLRTGCALLHASQCMYVHRGCSLGDVDAASSDLDKTRSRVQDWEGLVQCMQAVGADELKRRWAAVRLQAIS
jgi:hypothetical protein